MTARMTLIAVLCLLACAVPAQAAAPASCGSGAPDEVMTGEFESSRQGSFVLLPFDVPEDTTQVRVRYCYDQPQPGGPGAGHTLDLGLYEPRRPGRDIWSIDEFRGWSGSGYDDVSVTPQGFSSEAQYLADPKQHVPGRTTRSFRPGPIPDGEWAVELGLANIEPPPRDADGKVAYRVEVLLDDDPAFADDPYEPPSYDEGPARRESGWYAGDFHVHGEHSGDANASMDETFDFAFGSPASGGAGLDFISLADHNTDSAWPEIGRRQSDHPDNLVLRSQEVTTYRGHANNHAGGEQSDYRTGPLLERRPGGSLERLRGPQPPSGFLGNTREAGGFAQINHPTLFPAPPFPANLCRGCEWEYSKAQTDYGEVDAIEVATGPGDVNGPGGPGPNPFTVTAIEFWEDKLDDGHRIAAVGGSDDHRAGEPEEATQSAIGEPTTVVFAEELSEEGVGDAVRAGHTYVKVTGSDRPDLRFEAREPGSSAPAKIMGDTVRADEVRFVARVLDGAPGSSPGGPYELTVLKDGKTPVRTAPVTSDDFRLAFDSVGPGRYRLQLTRGTTIDAVSSPIYVETATGGEDPGGGSGGDDNGNGSGGSSGGGDSGDSGNGGGSSGTAGREETASEGSPNASEVASGSGPATGTAGDDGGALPLTGLALGGLVAFGAALAGGGTLLRRRAR